MRINKAVSSFSLLLLLCAFALGQDYRALQKQLAGADVEKAREVASRVNRSQVPTQLEAAITEFLTASEEVEKYRLQTLKDTVDIFAEIGSSKPTPPERVKEEAKKIKSSPLYRDSGVETDANWLRKAVENLMNLFRFERRQADLDVPDIERPGMQWLVYVVWFVIGAVVLAFVGFAVRHFRWQKTLKRKVRTMLEEDEPDRTADEWLMTADELASQGRYREAVRSLYLACLLRFDEHRVARFDRGQTNWEHLHRIHASPNRPPELDFEPQTQAFDRIWYGFHVRGMEDVAQFRAWYQDLLELLRRKTP